MAPRSVSVQFKLSPETLAAIRSRMNPVYQATIVSGGSVPEEAGQAAAPDPFAAMHTLVDTSISRYLNGEATWSQIEEEMKAAFQQAFGWPLGADGMVPFTNYGERQQLEYELQRNLDRHWWRESDGVRDNWEEEERSHSHSAVAWIWFNERFYLIPKDPANLLQGSWGCYRIHFGEGSYRVEHMSEVPGSDRAKPPAFRFDSAGRIDHVDVWSLNPREADTAAHELIQWVRRHAPSLEATGTFVSRDGIGQERISNA